MITTVLLVGNPNVGKSSLFNALTGARQRVVNAPGTTVELEVGSWRTPERTLKVVDLPGTVSLVSLSPDEHVTADAVLTAGPSDLAVVVLDATALPRSLYLLAQAASSGARVIAAVTMLDVARARGIACDPAALAAALGVPVVPVDPRTRTGLDAFASAVLGLDAGAGYVRGLGHARPTGDATPLETADALFAWVETVLDAGPATHPRRTLTDTLDRYLLRPAIGIPVFLVVIWAVFSVVTFASAPAVDAVAGWFSGPVSDWARSGAAVVGLGGGWVESLVVDGLLTGVGTALSFVPLMGAVFLAVSALEASGYLARASVVADRAMRKVGLDGRAILPLIVGFGCNLPALGATRTIPDARQRLITALVIPLTSCTARLTVYLVLAVAFFPRHAGTAVFGLYLLSATLVVGGALIMRGRHPQQRRPNLLITVLPDYQWPSVRTLLSSALTRVGNFLNHAGRIIVVALIVMWALLAIPVGEGDGPEHSAFGVVASATAPAFAPMGLDDWRISAALVSGFVAKEVVVGSLAQSHAVADPTVNGDDAPLTASLRATLDASSGGHAAAAALAFMVFVLAYTPCVATLAELRRTVGLRWTAGAAVAQLTVAWLLATAVFQIGRLMS